jgi:monofunctional biosynthetic peptidoglycan transglycosylase
MRKILGRFITILWKAFLAFFILSIVSVVIFRWVPVPITPLMVIRNFEQMGDGKGIVMEHDWESLDNISPKLQLAVVCSEDQNYLKHFGVD